MSEPDNTSIDAPETSDVSETDEGADEVGGEIREHSETADSETADSEVADLETTGETDSEMDPEPETVPDPTENMQWFVLKVSSNRENSIRDAILWRIKREGMEEYFGQVVIPTEKVAEKTKTGKKRVVTRKLYPGYMMIQMELNDDTWYLVRDTNGVGDFTGAAGKPIPMEPNEVERMLGRPAVGKVETATEQESAAEVVVDIPYHEGDNVKINDGPFVGFEGIVDKVDSVNGKITVLVDILGQPTPVELEYWQVETVS